MKRLLHAVAFVALLALLVAVIPPLRTEAQSVGGRIFTGTLQSGQGFTGDTLTLDATNKDTCGRRVSAGVMGIGTSCSNSSGTVEAAGFRGNAALSVGISFPGNGVSLGANDSGGAVQNGAFIGVTNNGTAISSASVTSGTFFRVGSGVDSFAPSSGTGTFDWAVLNPVINQTGGASGTTRGLRINPTLTSAADFRAVEIIASSVPVCETDYVSTSANGAQEIRGQCSESLTLSTSGATTDTTNNLLPANSLIDSVTTRVTTTITTATAFSVGDATTAARFSASAAGLTSGSTRVGIDQWSGAVATLAAGPSQAAAAKVRITTTGTPGAGVIRITVFYHQFVAPTS